MNQVLIKFIKSVIPVANEDELNHILNMHTGYVDMKEQFLYTRETLMTVPLNDKNKEIITAQIARVDDEIRNANAFIEDTVSELNAFLESVKLVQ